MLNLNKIVVAGHLGKDAETLNFKNGGCVIKFSVATTEKYTKKDGTPIENTTWFNVEIFRKSESKLAEYLKKGNPVYVEGKIKNETYDKEDGTKGYSTKVVASNIQLLGAKKDDAETEISGDTEEAPF
jgi:single-strand DNA-binding protein